MRIHVLVLIYSTVSTAYNIQYKVFQNVQNTVYNAWCMWKGFLRAVEYNKIYRRHNHFTKCNY